jgi:Carbohydrate-binding module 48 (Isoamylase N-terminal domain)/Alpha amylase, catalytic domain
MWQHDRSTRRLGATFSADGTCEFNVWAPRARQVEVCILDGDRREFLALQERGYYRASLSDLRPEMRYVYKLDDNHERADPASLSQPEGVFGPSQIVDIADFQWLDQGWPGPELKDYILYELHVGTYTPAGTLDAITDHLADLKSLGITAIEIMPLSQFPGERNWGYDGVFPFAVQNSYGGPRGLQRVVNACHRQGLAVVPTLSTITSVPRAISSAISLRILPIATARPGARPSTSMVNTAMRSPDTSSKTHSHGWRTFTSTPCGWTQFTASSIEAPSPFSLCSALPWKT